MEKSFLNEKYPDLDKSPEVESAARRARVREGKRAKDSNESIDTYLGRLEEIFREPEEGERQTLKGEPIREQRINILKSKLHELFVIKGDDVPEGYFALQQKIAREQGHGDVEITDDMRKQMNETIIHDQEQSLDNWVDFSAGG